MSASPSAGSSGQPNGTMMAAVLYAPRDLRIEQRPVPTPSLGEVLVQILSVGVCGSDVHYYEHGRIGDFVVRSPLVLGHESSGQIVAVGKGVSSARVGERVAIEPGEPCRRCDQCRAGRYNLCPNIRFHGTPPVDGTLSEFVTVQSDLAYAIPDEISDNAGEFDAFIDCSGSSAAIAAGVRLVRPGGSVVLVGMGADELRLPLGVVQQRELIVTGTFRYANTWPTAIALVASGRVSLDDLVTGEYGLAEVEQALTAGRDPQSVKAVVQPSRNQPA